MRLFVSFIAICLLLACSKDEEVPECVNEDTVEYSFSQEQLDSAAAYSAEKGGAAVLVMQYDDLIFEDYHNGASAETSTHVHSGTKGFFAAVVAKAIEEGLIESYDEVLANTITEWQDEALHPGKQSMTVRHLVSLTSGLEQDIFWIQGDDPAAPDLYEHAVDNLELNWEPGTNFQYGPSHYYAFGVFFERKLQAAGLEMNPLEYLENSIFEPIGLEYTFWNHDDSGNPHIPNGAHLTPLNWMRFGQLLLNFGSFQGETVIEPEAFDSLLQPLSVNPGHGVFLWLNLQDGFPSANQDPPPEDAAGGFIYYHGFTDLFACMGAGKNRMYMIPSIDAIILRQSEGDTDEYSDHEFLSILLDPLLE